MPNYQNGKIYKIYSYENDDIYYGSTIETLSSRISKHKYNFKNYKEGKRNYMTSIKILELTSAKIELVENYPCNNKEELLQREGYYIRNNNCVNKVIPDRKKKEYGKIYHEQNKEQINEQKKEYREQNKEQIKEYREQNKEKNKEYQKEYSIQNKEKNKERLKKYREQNRDEIKRKQNERYKEKKEQALMLKEDTNINI